MLFEDFDALWQNYASWCLPMVNMVDFVSYFYISTYLLQFFYVNYVLYQYDVIWGFVALQ